MRLIGKTGDGGFILSMSLAEATSMKQALEVIDSVLTLEDGPENFAPLPDGNAASPTLDVRETEKSGQTRKGVGGKEKRTCLKCGKSFSPVRKDQRCCSKKCRVMFSNGHRKTRPATIMVKPAGSMTLTQTTAVVCTDCRTSFEPSAPGVKMCPKCKRRDLIRKADANALTRRDGRRSTGFPLVPDSGIGTADGQPEFEQARREAAEARS